MQQTEKYQFNLIEGSDPFLPEALNENAVKAEQALEENRAEASGALAELAAEVTALTRVELYPYVGAGDITRTFTFAEQPQAVIFVAPNSAGYTILSRYSATFYPSGYTGSSGYLGKATWQGSSLRLGPYASGSFIPAAIFNQKDYNYLLIAMYGDTRDDFMPAE